MCCVLVDDQSTNAAITMADLEADRAFRIQGTGSEWSVFQSEWRSQRRAKRAQRLTAKKKRERWLTPAEKAARGTARPRFLDRMPCQACAEPLTPSLGLFETFMYDSKAPRGVKWAAVQSDGSHSIPLQPSDDEWLQYQKLCKGNITCFTDLEKDHHINFFEQRDVCAHCGCERFRTTDSKQCCQFGKLLLHHAGEDKPNYPLPRELLHLITSNPGLSKQSRAANDLFRFAQFALPKGTHRIPDSFKHLKVTGIPFAIVPNLNEMTSTRSFLDDPYLRYDMREHFDRAVRPTDIQIDTINTVMNNENSLVHQPQTAAAKL